MMKSRIRIHKNYIVDSQSVVLLQKEWFLWSLFSLEPVAELIWKSNVPVIFPRRIAIADGVLDMSLSASILLPADISKFRYVE